MDFRHAEASPDLAVAKVIYEDQVLGFEDISRYRLPQHTKQHILARPDLGSAQMLVLVVMSSSFLAASASLFLEAFEEPEGMKGSHCFITLLRQGPAKCQVSTGFPDPRFLKALGNPEVWERMCKAAKGELTSDALKGTRYLTSKAMPNVVETLKVHGREVGANQTEKGYPRPTDVERNSKKA